MYCSNCGHEVKGNSTFCPFCGVQIEKTKKSDDIKKVILNEKQPSKSSKVVYYIIALVVVIVILIIVVVISKKAEENRKEQVKRVLYDFAEAYNSGDMLKLQEIMPYEHMHIEQTELENLISQYEEESKHNYPLELLVKEITRMKKTDIELLESSIGRLLLGSFLIEDISRGYMVEVSIKLDEDILKENMTFEVIKVNETWYVNPVAMEDLSEVQEEYLDNKIDDAIELYSGFVGSDENIQKLTNIINESCNEERKSLRFSANGQCVYIIEDFDGDRIPELILQTYYWNESPMSKLYIVNNQIQVTKIIIDGFPTIYKNLDSNFFYYVDNTSIKRVYNTNILEETINGTGTFKEEIVAKLEYDEGITFYDAQDNIISEEKAYSFLEDNNNGRIVFQYDDFYFLKDTTALDIWR